jgi:hypothetical protein
MNDMKSRQSVVEIKGVKYLYDIEGKRLVSVANPKHSIAFSRLKSDRSFSDFFESIDGIQDINQRSVHVIVQKHVLLDQKPSKEEQAFLQAYVQATAIKTSSTQIGKTSCKKKK